jgi:rubrerythrin
MQQENRQCFLSHLAPKDRRRLLEILSREYIEEMQNVLQFLRHAERMRYPQFRDRLLRIAGEEQAHTQWLQATIIALGGEIPQVSFSPEVGLNSWECLLMDLEEEKRCCADLDERMLTVARIHPEIAEGLRRIREEEEHHREEIMDMLMRSDPQAWSPG